MNRATRQVRLGVYDLPEGETIVPDRADGACFLYVLAGGAGAGDAAFGPDEGRFVSGRLTVAPGAQAWLFEMSAPDAPFLDAEIVAAHIAALDFSGPCILRADRVESEHGARTPRHRHRGPGLRRLIRGRLRAQVGEDVWRIEAGQAWFESGAEPVVGVNYGGGPAAFVRLLVLPAELAGGKSSFVPADAAEADRPRSVKLRVFAEVSLAE